MKQIIINSKNQGQRLDKYLIKYFCNANSSLIYKSIRKKNITLNKKKCIGNEQLKQGDSIEVFFSDETFDKLSSSKSIVNNDFAIAYNSLKGIKVIFENEDILIIDKPAGILCQKSKNSDISVNEWIIGYLQKTNFPINYNEFRPSICNRIDRNTSGIVLCAKTYRGSKYLFSVISERKINKFYIALCEGIIREDINLEGYLYKDKRTNKVTIYKLLEEIPDDRRNEADYIHTSIKPIRNNGSVTLLDIKLHTGKSHQIRAHLASIGHPLCGDVKYGGHKYCNKSYQLLHAHRIEFPSEDNETLMEMSAMNGVIAKTALPSIYDI